MIYIYYIFLLSSLPKCELWMVAVLSVEPTTQLDGWWLRFFGVGGSGRVGREVGKDLKFTIYIFHSFSQQN